MSRPEVTTAVDAVARELRAAILAGDPAPGERLPEEALAARYEVARHTVRAALRALAGERLVVVSAHRGARVARLEGDELTALFELRTALEVEAARLLATRSPALARPDALADDRPAALPNDRPAAWPDAVREAADELDRQCRTRPVDRRGVDEAHLALHHALVAAAGSPRITAAHAALAAEQRLVLLQSRSTLDPGRMAALHRDLLTGLRRTGPDALRHHLAAGQSFSTPH